MGNTDNNNIKIIIRKIILVFLACAFILAPAARQGAAPVSADSVMNDLQKQINDRRASITANANTRKDLEQRIAALRNQQANAMNDKKLFDELITAIEFAIKEIEELILDYEELISREEAEIQKTQDDYEKYYALFLELIKFSYEEGVVDYLGLLVKSDSFTDFLSRMDTIANILEYNKTVINNLEHTKDNLEKRKKFHEDAITEHGIELERLAASRREVDEWRKKAEAAIEESNRKIRENIALQAELDKIEKDTQNEISRLQREYQARQESLRKYVGGDFLWPLPVSHKTVSSEFGPRNSPITGRREHHNGIDIPAPYNTDVYAANDGTVILEQYSSGYGWYVVIDHGGGKSTLYAHNTKNLKKVGDTVKRGDVIAKVGSTGWSTGPHVHFSYYEDGEPKNPLLHGLRIPG